MGNETFGAWRAEVAEELGTLAMLHSAELDATIVAQLLAADYPCGSVLPDDDAEAHAAIEQLKIAVRELAGVGPAQFDDLAADFAAIYLNGTLHVSPNESVWLDEDHLQRQQPMFEVREWYARHGLAVADWRQRADDNLSLQLLFVGKLLMHADDGAAIRDATGFMDQHLLRWLGDFSLGVATRCATHFYAALAIYTYDRMRCLRCVLAELGGIEGVLAPQTEAPKHDTPATAPLRYSPGANPGW